MKGNFTTKFRFKSCFYLNSWPFRYKIIGRCHVWPYIMFWIIDDHARVDSEFWTSWSKNNQEIAKLFWPIVSEIGVNDAYLILPEFVEATRRVSSAEEFKRDVMPQLVVLYNALAEDFSEAGDFDRVTTLANLALEHDPQNAESLRLQTEAARQLENANLGDKDLATSRELE